MKLGLHLHVPADMNRRRGSDMETVATEVLSLRDETPTVRSIRLRRPPSALAHPSPSPVARSDPTSSSPRAARQATSSGCRSPGLRPDRDDYLAPRALRPLRSVTSVALQVTAIWTDRRHLDMSLAKAHDV